MKRHPAPKKKDAPQPRGRKKRAVRATVVTKHHPEGVSALAGSVERLEAFRARAHTLKIRGYTYREIGEMIRDEFELVSIPPIPTVQTWIVEARKEGLSAQRDEVEEYVRTFKERSEKIIRALMPTAIDRFVVEEMKVVDGEKVPVIRLDVLEERIKSATEIRKQGESVLRAMGVGRAEQPGDAVNGDSIKTFIIQTVNNHIARSGEVLTEERAQTVLELKSGDPIIDSL